MLDDVPATGTRPQMRPGLALSDSAVDDNHRPALRTGLDAGIDAIDIAQHGGVITASVLPLTTISPRAITIVFSQ